MQQYSFSTAPASTTNAAYPGSLVGLIAKIGCIIFIVEAVIMMAFRAWGLTVSWATTFADSTLVTLISAPIIYYWAVRPFAEDAAAARQALIRQLEEARKLVEEKAHLTRTVQQCSKVTSCIYDRTLVRIGADLHDGPAQSLTFALLQLGQFEKVFESSGQTALVEEVRDVYRVIQGTVSEIRAIATGFTLPEIRDLNVQGVVNLVAHRHWLSTGVKAGIHVDDTCQNVSLSHRAAIYRFVQEALSNTHKHSSANRVTVRVETEPQLTVTVEDDGKGFDPSTVTNCGLGLTGIQARMSALFGSFEVLSAPGAGTTLVARFGSNLSGDGDCR